MSDLVRHQPNSPVRLDVTLKDFKLLKLAVARLPGLQRP